MLPASAFAIEYKQAFGLAPHQQAVACLQRMERRRQAALWDKLKEKLNLRLQRTRDDRIGTLEHPALALHPDGHILARFEAERLLRPNANRPEIGGMVLAPYDSDFLVPVGEIGHDRKSRLSEACSSSILASLRK